MTDQHGTVCVYCSVTTEGICARHAVQMTGRVEFAPDYHSEPGPPIVVTPFDDLHVDCKAALEAAEAERDALRDAAHDCDYLPNARGLELATADNAALRDAIDSETSGMLLRGDKQMCRVCAGFYGDHDPDCWVGTLRKAAALAGTQDDVT